MENRDNKSSYISNIGELEFLSRNHSVHASKGHSQNQLKLKTKLTTKGGFTSCFSVSISAHTWHIRTCIIWKEGRGSLAQGAPPSLALGRRRAAAECFATTSHDCMQDGPAGSRQENQLTSNYSSCNTLYGNNMADLGQRERGTATAVALHCTAHHL